MYIHHCYAAKIGGRIKLYTFVIYILQTQQELRWWSCVSAQLRASDLAEFSRSDLAEVSISDLAEFSIDSISGSDLVFTLLLPLEILPLEMLPLELLPLEGLLILRESSLLPLTADSSMYLTSDTTKLFRRVDRETDWSESVPSSFL